MKKFKILTLLFISILLIAGCSKNEEKQLQEVYDDKPSIRGVVKSISDDTVIMESRDRTLQGDIRVNRKTEIEGGEGIFGVGDTIIVYYDGQVHEIDPPQINTVYAFVVEKNFEENGDDTDTDSGNDSENDEPGEVEENQVDSDGEGVDGYESNGEGSYENSIGFKDENYFDYPILAISVNDELRELDENESALVHDVINAVTWEEGAIDDFEGDYVIMENGEDLVVFNSSIHTLNDMKNDISVKLHENLSKTLKGVLDGEL